MSAVLSPPTGVNYRTIAIPLVWTEIGDWHDADTARSTEYWARHVRDPVRLAAGLGRLLDVSQRSVLEVGPRTTLSMPGRQHEGLHPTGSAAAASLGDTTDCEVHRVPGALCRPWSESTLPRLTGGVIADASDFPPIHSSGSASGVHVKVGNRLKRLTGLGAGGLAQ